MAVAESQYFPPPDVLDHWKRFSTARIQPVTTGLINVTYMLQTNVGERAVLQRLHPVFSPQVNLDIAAVTDHLAGKGIPTPLLLPTDSDALWVSAQDGVWRALSWVEGQAHDFLANGDMAEQAGALVGRFHAALNDLNYSYQSGRSHVHDTHAHLTRLIKALEQGSGHRLHEAVARLADPLLQDSAGLVNLQSLPQRHAHGDLKISNLLFEPSGKGLALIDLDTLTRMHWPLEMGDALRSWCNPRREDQLPADLNLDLMVRAMAGYLSSAGDLITEDEWELLVPGLARICLELASRFLADALEERYFGWNPHAYGTRGDHNLARGRAMWALYRDVLEKSAEAQRRLGRL